MGRPTKLNKNVQNRICAALLACNTLEGAAAYGGIHYDTMNEWRKRGQAEIDRIGEDKRRKIRESEKPYVEFSEAIKRAIDESEAALITDIRAAGRKQWQANAWIAERRWPKRWSKIERHQIEEKSEQVVFVYPGNEREAEED